SEETKHPEKRTSVAFPSDIQIRRADLPPIVTDIPPYLFVEIANNSPFAGRDIELLIDLGANKLERVAIRPKDRCAVVTTDDVSPIRIRCTTLNGGESLFAQASVALPQYRKITTFLGGERGSEATPTSSLERNASPVTFLDVVQVMIEVFAGAIVLITLG